MKLSLSLAAVILLATAEQPLAQLPVLPKPPVGVPADARLFNGKWYRVYLEKGGWRRAKERCAALRGQLAIVPDEATHVFIRQLADSVVLWLGATDEKVEGQWVWSDGSKMTFKAWGDGQPEGARNEHYLCIYTAGKWHDAYERGDDKSAGFICEWKAK